MSEIGRSSNITAATLSCRSMFDRKSPVEQAFDLARTGRYANFTAVKRALRRQFNVDRELVGRSLGEEITALCKLAFQRIPAE
jgi:hypothetical protein